MTIDQTANSIAEATMRAFANATCRARPESPLAKAREALGDKYTEVAVRCLRVHTKTALDQVFADAKGGAPMALASLAFVATVVADTAADLITAAEEAQS